MITKQIAQSLAYRDELVHKVLKDSRGQPMRARVNGKVVTWKTKPDQFKLPMKHGLRDTFYITEHNAHQWEIPT